LAVAEAAALELAAFEEEAARVVVVVAGLPGVATVAVVPLTTLTVGKVEGE
jgi:hypothetical protein